MCKLIIMLFLHDFCLFYGRKVNRVAELWQQIELKELTQEGGSFPTSKIFALITVLYSCLYSFSAFFIVFSFFLVIIVSYCATYFMHMWHKSCNVVDLVHSQLNTVQLSHNSMQQESESERQLYACNLFSIIFMY